MQDKLSGLYIVATPIGNYQDITLRALYVLEHVDFIICEDTRVTDKLLSKYGLKKPMFCYNDHSNERDRNTLIYKLQNANSAALVSDAGTPLVSDPGYKLVQGIKNQNIQVTAVPGPSAVVTALALSGLPCDRFMFLGFLPSSAGERRKVLTEVRPIKSSLIFFESARRLLDSLEIISEVLGRRHACVARELTKLHEEVRSGTLDELLDYYQKTEPPRGEIVIVIGPPTEEEVIDEQMLASELKILLRNMSVKDATALMAEQYPSLPKKMIYNLALSVAGKK